MARSNFSKSLILKNTVRWLLPIGLIGMVTLSLVLADSAGVPVPAGTGTDAAPAAGAAGAAVAGTAPAAPGLLGMAFPFILMFGILYFLVIRPQQKRVKQHSALLGALKQGDEVVTSSGILGKISGLTEKVATLEIDQNVRIKILKSQIAQVVKGPIQELEPQR